MDYEYKNYHDNRAFQFHNNNTLTKGKTSKATTTKIYGLPLNDANTLDVVIVQNKSGGTGNYASGKLLESLPNHKSYGVCNKSKIADKGKTSSVCRRHQRRHKHNATQTPLMATGWQQLGDDGRCTGGIGGISCPSCLSICTMSSCVKHAHCFHHGEQHLGAGAGAGLAEVTCHCHITHHCHQYSPSGQSSKKGKDQSQRKCYQHHEEKRAGGQCKIPHHQHQYHSHNRHNKQQEQNSQLRRQENHQSSCSHYSKQLPTESGSFKSSIDSSAEQICQQSLRQSQSQEVAIEIDAVTMTEDNGSTATSNFPYKMAKDQKGNQENNLFGEKRSSYNSRRLSINSNTTIETDELSRDEDDNIDNDDYEDEQREHNEVEKLTLRRKSARTETNSSTTPRAICSDLDDGSGVEQDADGIAYCPYGIPLSNDVHNECVRIERKRFLPNDADFCSSCSSCSCARCDDNTSSCSSLDNDELADYNASTVDYVRPPHEFTVSAECHHCNIPRQSSSASTMGEADDEADELDRPDCKVATSSRSVSSTHTSRRSSESFCSCNSNSRNYCSCSCDECDTTGRMRTAREEHSNSTEAPLDLDEQHSSTLTPLTNPSSIVSTPLADDAAADVTIRSGNSHVFSADDASSLSQSAEYFSIASSNPRSRDTPTITPVHKPIACKSAADKGYKGNNSEHVVPPLKQCKHYSKHHRHKHSDTKQEGFL